MNLNKKQNYIAAFIGTALEFYDFALFGLLAPVFSIYFFPHEDPFAALMASYGIFAAGFFMRPLGGIIFGYIGDTYGRKKAMVLSIMMMIGPTSLIGMIPTYDQVGVLAPFILTLCRLVQGLSVGGEFSGAAIFAIEHAPINKRYFLGSLITASSVVGMLMASVTASFSVYQNASHWGWRIPFLLSIPISFIGLYVRRYIQETSAFNKTQKDPLSTKQSLRTLLRNNLPAFFVTFGIGGFIGIVYYVPFVFMGHHHALVSSISPTTSLRIITLGLTLYMITIALAGYSADKVGPQKVMFSAITATFLLAFPSFWLINSGQLSHLILGEAILAALAGLFVGPANGLTATLFAVQHRCRGVSFSLSLGISLFGGLAPFLLTYMAHQTQIFILPAILLCLGASMGACAVLASSKIQMN